MKIVLFYGLFLFISVAESGGPWDLPVSSAPDQYGNVLINRTSEKNGVKPAVFSHWLHRRKHTCRVCHFELEFNMKVNTTEITEAANKSGKYCGAGGCHDGKAAFGHDDPNCERCHNGDAGYGKKRFSEFSAFPKTKFGNHVNWVRALKNGLIAPVGSLEVKPANKINYNKTLSLEAEWSGIPAPVFPHEAHVQWLDCNNCHPEIFNVRQKTTKHFSMNRILKGEFCGVCHLNVAFPMDDCKRCHPGITEEFGNY